MPTFAGSLRWLFIKLPTLGRFVRWLFSWRSVRAALFALLACATLVILFYGVENWRGRYAWKKYRADAERRGANFEFKTFLPPQVPDEQNFAMTPLLRPMFDYVPNSHPIIWRDTNGWNRVAAISAYGRRGFDGVAKVGDWMHGQRTDLEIWQRLYRNEPQAETNSSARGSGGARGNSKRTKQPTQLRPEDTFPTAAERQSPAADVLLALTKFDAVMTELQAAVRRPHSRFPIHYDEDYFTLLPHLAKLKAFSQMFQLRAVAHLAQTNQEAAFADLETQFRLADSLKDELFLISQAVRNGLIQSALHTVWEGAVDHRWTAPQLERVQRRLAAFDMPAEFIRPFQAERSFHLLGMEHGLQNRAKLSQLFDMLPGRDQPTAFSLFVRYAPSGWFYQNEIAFNRRVDQATEGIEKAKVGGVFVPLSFPPSDPGKIYEVLLSLFPGEVMTNLLNQFPRVQTQVKLAEVGCALERFHLAHQAYPQTLAELTPQFIARLPNDFMDGQPLRYRRLSEHGFKLYSIGLNLKDDDGTFPSKDNAATGDWMWEIR